MSGAISSAVHGFVLNVLMIYFHLVSATDQELKLIYSSNKITNFQELPPNLNPFPSADKINLFNKFNAYFTSQTLGNSDIEDNLSSNPINCKYFNISDFCSSNFDSICSFSAFHMNISSLNAHFDELNAMINLLNFNFSIIGLTETKLKKITWHFTSYINRRVQF